MYYGRKNKRDANMQKDKSFLHIATSSLVGIHRWKKQCNPGNPLLPVYAIIFNIYIAISLQLWMKARWPAP